MTTIAAVFALGCSDYFERDVVARAGEHELEVDWFSETIANGKVVLRPPIIERWAWTWIQYSLFVQRLAEGDSLTDTTTVLDAMWPEVMTATVNNHHERLAAEAIRLDSDVFDSVYAAGEYRVIDHILIQASPELPPDQKSARRGRAAAIRATLLGGGSWDREALKSEDGATRSSQGRLGVVKRGQTVPEFEQVAFSLPPGGISDVVETSFGFHIIRRPPLSEVRDYYERVLGDVLFLEWVDDYRDELTRMRHVQVLDEGPDIIREAADRPFRILALEPGKVIGTYDGGHLTDVDFVGWLQALPPDEHERIEEAGDAELRELARRAMQYEIQFLEAKSVGTQLDSTEFDRIKRQLEGKLQRVRSAMRVDSALARAQSPEERRQVAKRVLDDYIVRSAETLREMWPVPPFLARKLRAEGDWKLSYPALNRAIRQAVELRAVRDSAQARN